MEEHEEQIRVGIVEDHDIFRKRMNELLHFYKEMKVVIVADSAEDLFTKLDKCAKDDMPQVVLMDIELPGMSGIDATFNLQQRNLAIDIIMFTVFEDDERIFESIQVGAAGYLLKDTSIEHVVDAIKEMRNGGSPISPSIARRIFEMMRSQKKVAKTDEVPFDLTASELKILEHVIDGKTNKEIAEAVILSPWTVKTHIKNIYKKMHVNSRAAAVRLAINRNVGLR